MAGLTQQVEVAGRWLGGLSSICIEKYLHNSRRRRNQRQEDAQMEEIWPKSRRGPEIRRV